MAFSAKRDGDLTVDDLRGGMNDSDPPSDLAEDQVVLAENIEFFSSCLGERRNGCEPFDIIDSGLIDEAVIVHLSQWFPTNEVLKPEFIAIGATPNVSASIAAKRPAIAWASIPPIDAFDTTEPDIYQVETQSLNGKLFVAYHSAVDRLHVWDGTSWRRAGLTAPPGPPTGVDTGTGTYATIRYFRVRYATLDGTVIKRRSEASTVLAFTPSGTGSGVAITRPALINEGETHWELEASDDNATFYRIATTLIATDTVTDSSPFPTDYAVNGVLSETSGTNLLLPSAKYLAVDGDRLVFGSHWTDKAKQSLVGWTPVANDPGVGNDERLPLETNNTVNLDNYDGGALTGLVGSATGTWYAFKWQRVYKFVRTGDFTRAYDVLTLSTTRGAITGSIVRGVDEAGQGVVYFLDPTMGPSRLGPYGIQSIVGMHGTWGQVNLSAEKVVSCGTYYPYKQQVHWWIATNGSNSPNRKLILQVNEIRPQQSVGGNGVGRGWSIATGRIAEAFCASTFTERVSVNGIVSISDRPFIGLRSPDFIQRCDVVSTDAGVPYRAILRSRPYLAAGLLNRWGAMTASLLATAQATTTLVVKFIRDFGLEEHQVTTPLAASALAEAYVIKDFDDLVMSESRAIQFELSDPPIPPVAVAWDDWEAQRLDVKPRREETA